MRRTYETIKSDILKKKAIKQAKALREKLESEHGEVFAKIREHAQRKHAEQTGESTPVAEAPSKRIEIKNIPIDRQKNLKTVLKFIEGRNEDGSTDDAFTKKIFDLMRSKH